LLVLTVRFSNRRSLSRILRGHAAESGQGRLPKDGLYNASGKSRGVES